MKKIKEKPKTGKAKGTKSKSQPALALPGGNGIFTATPTERITHYTLLRKVVCQMGGVAPFGTPHKKRRYATPPRGAYRLFLLSSPLAVSVEQKSAWDY